MMTETMPKCMNCWYRTVPKGLSPTKSRWYVWCAKHERNIKDFYSCDDYREDSPLDSDPTPLEILD